MSTLACALLRHDVRDRWIGDLRAVFCVTCDCLIVPDAGDRHEPIRHHDAPVSGRGEGLPPASASPARQVALSAAAAGA